MNPWPDAWCDQCNAKFLQEGEWNDRNSADLDLRILCHLCYERASGKSVVRLGGTQLLSWRAFAKNCHEELSVKQERLTREYALTRHKRWDWEQ